MAKKSASSHCVQLCRGFPAEIKHTDKPFSEILNAPTYHTVTQTGRRRSNAFYFGDALFWHPDSNLPNGRASPKVYHMLCL